MTMHERSNPVTVLILAAGHSPWAANDGNDYPVCLSEMDNRPLLEHIVSNAATMADARFLYAMREGEVRKYHLDNVAELLTPGAAVVRVPDGTQGAACTALLAACDIDADEELLVVSANELVQVDLNEIVEQFRDRQLDAGVLVFRSVHPRYSYVRLDEGDRVSEAAYRKPISHNATAGIFWFRRASDFTHAVKNMIRKDAHVEGVFSISPALNELILTQATVGAVRIANAAYVPIKTERQLSIYEQGVAAGAH